MPLVLIPTYNRSFKLHRVLDFYASYATPPKVVVLDGSDAAEHIAVNKGEAERHSHFVTRLEMQELQGLVPRLLAHLQNIDDDIVAIGNDEDAFFPAFLDMAFEHLSQYEDYVAVTGQYVTFGRPVFGLRRVMFWTDTFVGMPLDSDSAANRVLNFQRLNSGGVPPLFWSVRRKSAFTKSMELGKRIEYASGQEFIDQICTCATGKVLISELPMLLRDESRYAYVAEDTRDTGKHYMLERDLDEIEKIAGETWDADVAAVVRALTSWYRPRQTDESLQSRLHARSYCRFQSNAAEEGDALLGMLGKTIKGVSTAGVFVSQVLAYFYYRRYMNLQGKGDVYRRMAKTVATNQ